MTQTGAGLKLWISLTQHSTAQPAAVEAIGGQVGVVCQWDQHTQATQQLPDKLENHTTMVDLVVLGQLRPGQ